jgi:hypothetical protein
VAVVRHIFDELDVLGRFRATRALPLKIGLRQEGEVGGQRAHGSIVGIEGEGRDRIALSALARADRLVDAVLAALLASGTLGTNFVAFLLLQQAYGMRIGL